MARPVRRGGHRPGLQHNPGRLTTRIPFQRLVRLPGGVAGSVLLLVAVAFVAALAGYLTEPEGSDRPVEAGAEREAGLRGVVRQVAGDRLSLTTEAGNVDVGLTQGTVIEAVRPATLASISAGDWINAGAVPHNQTIFALLGLIVIARDRVMAPR